MFFSLLIVTFAIATAVSALVAAFFRRSIAGIVTRIVDDGISIAWTRYMFFAIMVVGISGGVRIYSLERFINPAYNEAAPLVLTPERWTLEIYRTIIETLQSLAWLLLVFFVITLLAHVIIRIFERRRTPTASE